MVQELSKQALRVRQLIVDAFEDVGAAVLPAVEVLASQSLL